MCRIDESRNVTAPGLFANIPMEVSTGITPEVRATLARTKRRVEQSKQRILETDKLIMDLSCVLLKQRNQKRI